MRGKEISRWSSSSADGITPAYAGKSLHGAVILFSFQDHPRLCGEKKTITKQGFFPPGSPPPMRGKACYDIRIIKNFRITPAYAGKSCQYLYFTPLLEDHPRLCGEKTGAGDYLE